MQILDIMSQEPNHLNSLSSRSRVMVTNGSLKETSLSSSSNTRLNTITMTQNQQTRRNGRRITRSTSSITIVNQIEEAQDEAAEKEEEEEGESKIANVNSTQDMGT